MAALLAGLEPGDEVIMPSYTFVSTANAFVRVGARPVFVDIRPDTLNLDERLIAAAITERTRAIVPVHYGGVACDMDRILEIARRHGLLVIEDAAQGVNAFYGGRALGSLGQLGCYSFHETKNYICGEGGALCLNAPELVERAEILRDKGTNRKQFFRGQVDKYTWVDVGSSYVPSEIACAFLYAQLEMLEPIALRRRDLHRLYRTGLAALQDEGLLTLPQIPADCTSNHHLFYVLLPDKSARNDLLDGLTRRGVQAVFHYVPLHTSPMGRKLGYRTGDLPVTESISARLLRLPLYHDLAIEDQWRVIESVGTILRASAAGTFRRWEPRLHKAA
jgi:dTDP-4-amino-4,6-dideoxygalactose transaminase